MSRLSSWVGNVTFWFQTKKNQQKDMSKENGHDQFNNPSDPLSRSILQIMNKPKDPPPNKPKP